jgi:hypothetical protein
MWYKRRLPRLLCGDAPFGARRWMTTLFAGASGMKRFDLVRVGGSMVLSRRALRTLPLAMVAVVATIALSGCASTRSDSAGEGGSAQTAGAAQESGGSAPMAVAGGDRYGRDIFDPLDLPPGNAMRSARGVPGPGYWQQRVDYRIAAELDAEARVLTGTARVRYVNNSPEALPYLWMTLEQNLFEKESTGALMWGKGQRFGNRDGFDGGYRIARVSLVSSGGAVIQPLEMDVYGTVGRIDLPTPVSAHGGEVSFEVAYSFDIPPYGSDRMGVEKVDEGTIFQFAQWFPAMCNFDDVMGWNILPYLGAGEFHTNFGDYELALTVPRSHLVAATGELLNPAEVLTPTQMERLDRARRSSETVMIRTADEVSQRESRPSGEGPLTWRFAARDVRTVAWTSSDAFIWDAAAVDGNAARVGLGGGAGNNNGTLVMSLYPKEGLRQWVKSTDMMRFSIEHYNRMWFRYPYPIAVNVNGVVGGMEYPMIVFCRERNNERGLFGVTTHEIGHNWFPMIVANDERRYAWMDEGLTSFINYYCTLERYPESAPRRGDPRTFAPEMRRGDDQPSMTYPDRLAGGRLGRMMYAKPATALVLLREHVLGAERFDRAFRAYIREWAFKHPQPSDFFRIMENEAGADLAWFWRGWFYETGTFDQAVTGVTQSDDGRANATFKSLRRMVLPTHYLVEYSDGSSERRFLPVESWYSSDTHVAVWETGGKRVARVTLDPESVLPDQDPKNNVWGK